MKRYLSVDLGATSGRVIAVEFADGKLKVEELGRFSTEGIKLPKEAGCRLVWDVPGFWREILNCLSRAGQAESIAVDGWGVDFALIDGQGDLLRQPTHYRDGEHIQLAGEVLERLGEKNIYLKTGVQIMPINTLYQLYALWKSSPFVLGNASCLFTIPDLFTYFLSGERICEYTNATTTQLYAVGEDRWAEELLGELGIPTHFLLPVCKPGRIVGEVRSSLGFLKGTSVIATASHDTASAIAGIPMAQDSVYISSGTWSLVGVEREAPLINELTFQHNFTNEGGAEKINFLRNVTGMWIFEECRRKWGRPTEELLDLEGISSYSIIDVDEGRFQNPGDMPQRISEYCREKGQRVPEGHRETTRVILESLALKYRWVIEKIEALTGRTYPGLHIVGGGARNDVLNQLTADITGRAVSAGPYEAAALGSAIIQMRSTGEIASIAEGREIIERSFAVKKFYPKKSSYEEKYSLLKEML